jgi:hypothetical protein
MYPEARVKVMMKPVSSLNSKMAVLVRCKIILEKPKSPGSFKSGIKYVPGDLDTIQVLVKQ